jgi:hypothetical protein
MVSPPAMRHRHRIEQLSLFIHPGKSLDAPIDFTISEKALMLIFIGIDLNIDDSFFYMKISTTEPHGWPLGATYYHFNCSLCRKADMI